MGEWTSKKYPDGCLVCHTKEKTHIGRGLCSTCYQREEKSVENTQDLDKALLSELSLVDDGPHGDRRGVLQDEEDLTPPLDRSGERRPGSGPSSVPPASDGAPDRPRGLRGLFQKKEKAEQPRQNAPSKEHKPKAKLGRRVSTADTMEDVLSGLGALATRTPKHYPLGRYLQFSAGVSAELIDDAIQGTIVDKVVLQPIVKGRGRYDALGAVFGPPAIILAIENDPSKAPLLIPLLKSSIRNSLPMMAKAIKKVQAKEAAMEQAAKELFPDLADGEDPVDGIIAMLFDGWIPPQAPAAEEPQEETVEEEAVA